MEGDDIVCFAHCRQLMVVRECQGHYATVPSAYVGVVTVLGATTKA